MPSYDTSNGLGLFQDHFATYMQPMMNGMNGQNGFDTWMRSVARCQLEMQGLMARRAQAYLELPGRITQCRTPQELVQEQTRFWQTAAEQYSECSRKVFGAWAQMFNLPSAFDQRSAGAPVGRERDYLSHGQPAVRRPSNGLAEPSPQQTSPQRRVA